ACCVEQFDPAHGEASLYMERATAMLAPDATSRPTPAAPSAIGTAWLGVSARGATGSGARAGGGGTVTAVAAAGRPGPGSCGARAGAAGAAVAGSSPAAAAAS